MSSRRYLKHFKKIQEFQIETNVYQWLKKKELKDPNRKHICRYYGRDADTLTIQLEKLSQVIPKPGEPDAYKLCRDLFNGLALLEKCKVIHGDLKPANLRIQGQGQERRLVIFDFGNGGIVQRPNKCNRMFGPDQQIMSVEKRSDQYSALLITAHLCLNIKQEDLGELRIKNYKLIWDSNFRRLIYKAFNSANRLPYQQIINNPFFIQGPKMEEKIGFDPADPQSINQVAILLKIPSMQGADPEQIKKAIRKPRFDWAD